MNKKKVTIDLFKNLNKKNVETICVCVCGREVSSSMTKRRFVYSENEVRLCLLCSSIHSRSPDDDHCIESVVGRAIAKNRYGTHGARIVLIVFGLNSYIGP